MTYIKRKRWFGSSISYRSENKSTDNPYWFGTTSTLYIQTHRLIYDCGFDFNLILHVKFNRSIGRLLLCLFIDTLKNWLVDWSIDRSIDWLLIDWSVSDSSSAHLAGLWGACRWRERRSRHACCAWTASRSQPGSSSAAAPPPSAHPASKQMTHF